MSAPANVAPGYVQVPSSRPVPPRISLLTSAEVITEPLTRWEGGFMYESPLTHSATFLKGMCGEQWETGVSTWRQCAPVTTDSFVLITGEVMSTFSKSSKDLYTRTRDTLLASESYYVEVAFCTDPPSYFTNINYSSLLAVGNQYTGSGTPKSVVDAFASLENEIMLKGLSMHRPMIFVTVRAMAHLARHQLIRREGNVWLSPFDTIVVPLGDHAFYGQEPPNFPAPGTDQEYMYGSVGVQIRRSELLVYPEQEAPTPDNPFGYPASAINRSTNNIAVSTQRIYGLSFNADVRTGQFPIAYAIADYTIPHV